MVAGGHIMPAESRANADSRTETVAGRHIITVAEMTAPAVGMTERAAGGHIMPVAMMVEPAVFRMGGYKPGTERVGSAPLTSVKGRFKYPDFTW